MAAKKATAAEAVNARGEIALELEPGVEYGLRPSYAAIEEIEGALRPLTALVREANEGMLSVADLALIAVPMMKAWGAAHPADPLAGSHSGANVKRVAELIFEAGVPKINARLFVVLYGALTGGYDASGEAKAAKQSPTA